MSDQENLAILIEETFEIIKQQGVLLPIDLAKLGTYLKLADPGFKAPKYGHKNLLSLLKAVDKIKIIPDDTVNPPRYFAEYVDDGQSDEKPIRVTATQNIQQENLQPSTDLYKFAYIPDDKWAILCGMVLKGEVWGENNQLLINYITYTFCRLINENKVLFSDDRSYAAFNTGLVDDRYEPIYALLIPNTNPRQPWRLQSFCISAESWQGKELFRFFSPLPAAAYYFDNPSDALFNVNYGEPEVSWKHVLIHNVERVPVKLLIRFMNNFEVKSCDGMNPSKLEEYKQSFATALENDPSAYRSIMAEFKHALDTALKRVRWNYKTAIPIYFPRENTMSMLLPLCLLSDQQVDCALVVERTDKNKYLGHTIYTLEMAYKGARLITRPDSDWLTATSFRISDKIVETNE